MSNVKCQMSNVKCQMSDVRCQMSNVKCILVFSFFFTGKNPHRPTPVPTSTKVSDITASTLSLFLFCPTWNKITSICKKSYHTSEFHIDSQARKWWFAAFQFWVVFKLGAVPVAPSLEWWSFLWGTICICLQKTIGASNLFADIPALFNPEASVKYFILVTSCFLSVLCAYL